MDIIRKDPNKRYSIQHNGKVCSIVKVLKDYKSEKEAFEDLTKLLVSEITEQDLIEGQRIEEQKD